MENELRREYRLCYRDEENGLWHTWHRTLDSLGQAVSEAMLLIWLKKALEVKAIEIIKGAGRVTKQGKEVFSLSVRGQNIEVVKGPEVSEEEAQEITRELELQKEQELKREKEIEIEQEGYGYGI